MLKYIILYLLIALISDRIYNSNNTFLIKLYYWCIMICIGFLMVTNNFHFIFLYIATHIPELADAIKNHNQFNTLEDIQRREREDTERRLAHEEYERKMAADNRRSSPDHF